MQLVIGVFYLVMLYIAGDRSTAVAVPFLGTLELGPFYYLLAMIIITGFVNAVNLTDGLDGLSSSVTFVYAVVFLVIAGILQFGQASVIAAALAGGTLGFLVWNFYPAKVFMGDTGSLFWAAWWWRSPSRWGCRCCSSSRGSSSGARPFRSSSRFATLKPPTANGSSR